MGLAVVPQSCVGEVWLHHPYQSDFGLLCFSDIPPRPQPFLPNRTLLSITRKHSVEYLKPRGHQQVLGLCGIFHLVACGYLGFQSVERKINHQMLWTLIYLFI